uniref:Uncharacterized protein n=1 Tax=Junco hyemalis TaxID=40217 RepID=A0A8C5JUD7_JUNHY
MRNHGWVGPWRPHRPRGPTSAVYGSPGPKYGVPGGIGECKDQRDPSGRRAPAYSFGMSGADRLPPGLQHAQPQRLLPQTGERGRGHGDTGTQGQGATAPHPHTPSVLPQDRKQGQTFGVRHSESVVPVMDLQL